MGARVPPRGGFCSRTCCERHQPLLLGPQQITGDSFASRSAPVSAAKREVAGFPASASLRLLTRPGTPGRGDVLPPSPAGAQPRSASPLASQGLNSAAREGDRAPDSASRLWRAGGAWLDPDPKGRLQRSGKARAASPAQDTSTLQMDARGPRARSTHSPTGGSCPAAGSAPRREEKPPPWLSEGQTGALRGCSGLRRGSPFPGRGGTKLQRLRGTRALGCGGGGTVVGRTQGQAGTLQVRRSSSYFSMACAGISGCFSPSLSLAGAAAGTGSAQPGLSPAAHGECCCSRLPHSEGLFPHKGSRWRLGEIGVSSSGIRTAPAPPGS